MPFAVIGSMDVAKVVKHLSATDQIEKNLTPSRPGPEQGFLFKSRVSKLELYF